MARPISLRTGTGSFGAIAISRSPTCRPCYYCRRGLHDSSSSASPSSQSQLERVLTAQDKYDRIRFEPPFRFLSVPDEGLRVNDIKKFYPDAVSAEPQLLPFYTVGVLTDQRRSTQNIKTGWAGVGIPERLYHSLIGCTVAAVPKSHWAHGVVLNDDINMTVAKPTLDDITSSAESYFTSQYRFFDPFLSSTFSMENTPLFAYGAPKLTRTEQQRVVSLQEMFQNGENWVEVRELQREARIFSFPHYRLVYKVNCPPSKIAFFDASDFLPNHHFSYPTNSTTLLKRPQYNDDDLTLWYKQKWADDEDFTMLPYIIRYELDPNETRQFHEIIVTAMERNLMNDQSWEDPTIFPLTGVPQRDIRAILRYCQACILGIESGPVPTFFNAQTSAPKLSPHLLRTQKKPANPLPSNNRLRVETIAPQSNLGRSTAFRDGRVRVLNARLKEQVARQKAWQTKVQGAPLHDKKGRTLASPKQMSDPRGYYRALNIIMRREFLDYDSEEDVNQEIRNQWHALSRQSHPDFAQTEQQWKLNSQRQLLYNEAYEHLKTCQKRIHYHETRLVAPQTVTPDRSNKEQASPQTSSTQSGSEIHDSPFDLSVTVTDTDEYYWMLALKVRPEFLQYDEEKKINDEIRKAYLSLSKKSHPDRAQTKEQKQSFIKLQGLYTAAYDNLATCAKRIQYQRK